MSDLLNLIRKTQPLYNHLSPAEAKILDELIAAVHDLAGKKVYCRCDDSAMCEIEHLREQLVTQKDNRIKNPVSHRSDLKQQEAARGGGMS